jgi:membrane AbrB-like protein
MLPQMKDIRHQLATFFVALIGVAAALLLGLPLPFLLGPLAATCLAALLGLNMVGFRSTEKPLRVILGVAAGAAITPAVIQRIPDFALSLSLIPIFLLVAGLIGYPFFRRVCGFSPATSFYAAMPGGFQDMLAFGEEAGGHVRTLSLIHASRVAVVVSLIPFMTSLFDQVDFTSHVGPSGSSLSLQDWLLMAVAGFFGWKIAERIGIFGAAILGPLALTAAFSLADLLHARPPSELLLGVQFLLGASIGARFVNITPREVTTVLTAGTFYSVLLCILSLGFAGAVHHFHHLSWLDVLLAYSPGGQGEMAILALAGGADLLFVVTHHILRLAIILCAAPIVFRVLRLGRVRVDP